ncbi:MAG: ABC transporter ATP-binding protein, partial [Halobacteriaceae archaeon]
KKYFRQESGVVDRLLGGGGRVKAVDGVDLTINKGETVSVVGESGCGKTTLGRTLIRLYDPTEGVITFKDQEITELSEREIRKLRKEFQIVFQNPFSSLNPRMTVGDIIAEPLETHGIASGEAKEARVFKLLDSVNLNPSHINRYPHEFSGGQRQRIGIARALAVNPEFIVCDEPVSALDVSVQAQILNLLDDLQDTYDISYLFITHNLSIAAYMADRIAVMYLGKIVERGLVDEVLDPPYHPYTKALLAAIPEPGPAPRSRTPSLEGEVPSPTNPPSGCRFRTRCPRAQPDCAEYDETPIQKGGNHALSCIHPIEDTTIDVGTQYQPPTDLGWPDEVNHSGDSSSMGSAGE